MVLSSAASFEFYGLSGSFDGVTLWGYGSLHNFLDGESGSMMLVTFYRPSVFVQLKGRMFHPESHKDFVGLPIEHCRILASAKLFNRGYGFYLDEIAFDKSVSYPSFKASDSKIIQDVSLLFCVFKGFKKRKGGSYRWY
jgi:hypothetical protein